MPWILVFCVQKDWTFLDWLQQFQLQATPENQGNSITTQLS